MNNEMEPKRILPSPLEVGYEVARLRFIRGVIDDVEPLSLGGPSDLDREVGLMAKEIQPGSLFKRLPQFENLVLSVLDATMPAKEFSSRQSVSVHTRGQNRRFVHQVEHNRVMPVPPARMPETNGLHDTEDALRRAVMGEGFKRLRLLEPGVEKRTVVWKMGVIAAAAMFGANITDPLSRRLYEKEEQIRAAANQFGDIKPRQNVLYNFYRSLSMLESHNGKVRLDGRLINPYRALWAELNKDLDRFEERRISIRKR